MKSKERHENWIKDNAPEFVVNNYEDVTGGGNNRQCSRCEKWFPKKDLFSEIGVSWYCLKCMVEDPERCCIL